MKTHLILFTLFAISLTSCTRPENDSSKLKVSIPAMNNGANLPMATSIEHLVINITGPGITTPIFFEWDREDNNSSATEISPELDVPTGSDRLIQVLAIYKNTTTQATDFHYGDSTVALKLPVESIEITANKINTSAVVTGSISGQYVTGVTTGTIATGPSGEVQMKYKPSNGKPALILEKTLMANGWFNVFGMTGLNLIYEVNGQTLFGGPLDMSSLTANFRVARTMVPVHKYKDQNMAIVSNTEPEIHVMGYFGDATIIDPKRVCHHSTVSLPNYYRYNSSAASPSDYLPITTSGGTPSIADLRSTSTPLQYVFLEGGADKGAPNGCMPMGTVDLYKNYLPFSPRNFMNGKDEAGGFRTPFGFIDIASPSNYKFDGYTMNVDQIAGKVAFFARLLPGVSDVITNVIAYRIPTAGASQLGDRAPCLQLATGQFGATKVGEIAPTAAGAIALQTTVNTGDMQNTEALAICMQSTQGMVPRGPVLRPSNSGPGPSGPYLRIQSADNSSSGGGDDLILTKNACHPVQLATYTGNGSPYMLTANTSFTGLPSSGSLSFYTMSNCSGPTTSSTISGGSAMSSILYVMATEEIPMGFIASITSAGDSVNFDGTHNKLIARNPSLKMEHPTNIPHNTCYPFKISTKYANGQPYPQLGAGITPSFDWNMMGVTVHSNESQCVSNSPSSTTLSLGASEKELWAKFSSPTTATLQSAYTGWDSYSAPLTVSGTQPMDAYGIKFTYLGPILVGKCIGVRASLVNANGVEMIAREPIPLQPSIVNANASLHADPNCQGTLGTYQQIQAGFSSFTFYLKPLNNSPIDFTQLTGNFQIYNPSTVTATDPANYIKFSAPGFFSQVISAEEFGASRMVILEAPAMAQLKCRQTFDFGMSWSNCPAGVFTGNVFNWTMANAVNKAVFEFTSDLSGSESAFVRFDPKNFYGQYFEVANCLQTLSGTVGSSAVQSALTANSRVCLDATAAIQCDSPITIGPTQSLVGRSSKNAVIYTQTAGISCFTVDPSAATPGFDTLIANLAFNLNSSCASGSMKGISVTGGTSGFNTPVKLLSNTFNLRSESACEAFGITAMGNNSNAPINIAHSVFNLDGDNQNATAVYMKNTHLSSLNFVKNTVTGSTPDYDTRLLYLEKDTGGGSGGGIVMDQNTINGSRLRVIDTVAFQSTPGPTIQMTKNYIDLPQEPGAPSIVFYGGSGHLIVGNRIRSTGSSNVFGNFNFDGAGPQVYTISHNKFIQNGNYNLFSTYVPGFETINVFMNQNSFLKTSTGGPAQIMVNNGVVNSITSVFGSGQPNLQSGNKVCYSTAGGAVDWESTLFSAPSGTMNDNLSLSSLIRTPNNETCY